MASTSAQSQIQIINAFDELAPTSASSSTSATSSSPLQKLPCDVFINHRGPDVKHTLATAIYNALHNMGLRVFLDSKDLQLGNFFPTELQETMSRASLHIAILSPTYAQSPWCLAELSFIIKTGKPIIPVFYQVQPNDLRHLVRGKEGIYADFFLKHQDRYSADTLEDWKKALNTVSFYMGEIINNNDEQQMVLKNIVNHVLKVLKIELLDVAIHPVGLEEVVADFEKTIHECAKTHSNVQIVGIWGMGGSGKTTLAKKIYNQKCTSSNKSSFVFDVRDAAAKRELHKKQIELLEDLGFQHEKQIELLEDLGFKHQFDNIEKGRGILSNFLRSVPVLIVLDDVDHTDQLEALLPAKDSLGGGSLIIVTTREKEVLMRWGISSIYKMKTMNPVHARKLFCWHAFLQSSPVLGFEELVEKFLIACNGLPLSLKVLGGQLYGYSSKDLWEDVLHKISKILPDDILNRLRVSYDALDKEEKQMFLDVACFFIGKNKMTTIAVWEGSGWNGLYGWERLLNKCLIDLDDKNEIKMHDHLRDLGREIASSLSPCRLWSPDQFTGIEKQEEIRGMILNAASMAVPKIRGIRLNAATNAVCKFLGSLLNRRTRLSFLNGLKVFVLGKNCEAYLRLAKLSRELAWLSCSTFAHRNLPSWMPLKNLRVLELYQCYNMVDLWKDEAEAPVQLRVLNISNCSELTKIPKSIGYLENLKKISLYNCRVKSLPEEFCRLQSLEDLQLKDCWRLSSLPRCFGHLTNLRHLDLSDSEKLEMLPDSFKQLTLLQHLNLENCVKLTLQSDILENMTKLEYLNLERCWQLEELPRHITNQASLSELYLRGTRLRELPINIGQLSKLRVMQIGSHQGFFQMQSLPDSMESLNLLEQLVLCNLEVQSLPNSLKQMIHLQTLEIISCPISELDFGRGSFTSSLSNLRKIDLQKTRLSKISISEDCCPGLKSLRLVSNEHLSEVDIVPTALEDLFVSDCKLLRNINGIGGSVNLRHLWLNECPELETLPSFDKLASLEVFRLRHGNKVEKIQGLEECTSLEEVGIDCKCWEVLGTESWEHLQRLRRLQLGAKERSAVETCIQTIQKWPEEVIIYTKAVAGAASVLNPSAFPNLTVLHSSANKKFPLNPSAFPNLTVLHSFANEKIIFSRLRWKQKKHSSNGNAMMLCFVINSLSPRIRLTINCRHRYGLLRSTEVGEGKWIWIAVFTQQSAFLTGEEFYLTADSSYNCEVEKGLVVRGEEDSVRKAFHYFSQLML